MEGLWTALEADPTEAPTHDNEEHLQMPPSKEPCELRRAVNAVGDNRQVR